MAAHECPDCGVALRYQATSCKCGWKLAHLPKSASVVDPNHLRCGWVANGDRCHYAGGISVGGPNGPWHCIGHHGCVDPLIGADIVAESQRDIPYPNWDAKATVERIKQSYILGDFSEKTYENSQKKSENLEKNSENFKKKLGKNFQILREFSPKKIKEFTKNFEEFSI